MLDIPVASIRNWEERYAAVVPERSAGGQRLYSPEQVEQLRFVATQVARGLSAADAHRLLAGREGSAPAPRSEAPEDHVGPLVLIADRDPVAAELVQSILR